MALRGTEQAPEGVALTDRLATRTDANDSAHLLALPLDRIPSWSKWCLAALVALLVGFVAALGAANRPDTSPPTSTEAAREIARTLHIPENADDILIGDYLIERFYMFDTSSGQLKIADVCKGRIDNTVVAWYRDWSAYEYRLVLDRVGLHAERDRVAAFVNTVAPPDTSTGAQYAGLVVQGGANSVFRLNYDGKLPQEKVSFRGSEGEDVFSFLRQQNYAEIGDRLRLLEVEGNNYLLRSTAGAQYYRTEFNVTDAIMLAELIVVDATAPAQAETFREITWNIPLRPVQ